MVARSADKEEQQNGIGNQLTEHDPGQFVASLGAVLPP